MSSQTRSPRCPLCGRGSSRVHSRYRRTVADLPWPGISVTLIVRARRFFCDEASCERTTSCERLPEVAARKTDRLEVALLAIVVELGGRASVSTTDYHTAGEPFRIVSGGVGPIPGDTVLDKREWATENLDRVRRLLVFEPRGHADMYGCFVTEPDDEEGDLGVVFFHNAGFSTACGLGTIALATWAMESGAIAPSEPETRMVVDAWPERVTRGRERTTHAQGG